jgi:hypothetical protein
MDYVGPGFFTEPRACQQDVFKLHGGTKVIEVPPPESPHTTWFQRGWTFQEYAFSRRRLIFGDNRIRWECKQSQWQEDIDHITGSKATPKFGEEGANVDLSFFSRSWPDLGALGDNRSFYNEREFTYPEDALAAFAGITSVIEGKFEGGFLCGLPEIFFDVCLLWRPNTHRLYVNFFSLAGSVSSADVNSGRFNLSRG